MNDFESWAKVGGAAGVLAGVVAYLYRKREATHAERIASYKDVVLAEQQKNAKLEVEKTELYERLIKHEGDAPE